MTDQSDIVARLENRAETLAQTALNGRDTRLIKLLETAAKEITALRASLQPATATAGEADQYTKGYRDGWNDREARANDAVAGDAKALAAKFESCDHAKLYFDADEDEPMRCEVLDGDEHDLIVAALRSPDVAGDVQAARTQDKQK